MLISYNSKTQGSAKKWPKMVMSLALTLALFACSSSSDVSISDTSTSDTDTNNTKFPSAAIDSGSESLIVTGFDNSNSEATTPWLLNSFIFKNNSLLDTIGEGSVRMFQYSDDFEVATHVDFFTNDLDVCEIDDPDAIPTGTGGNNGSGPPPLISGGASVVINTPSGPWFTYNRSIEDGESIYAADGGFPAELIPEGATISVPGDVFPTVAAHPIYSATPPQRLLPDADLPLTTNSAYSWIPNANKTVIVIDFLGYDADDNFVDFAGFCRVRDDGAFTMPSEVTDFISSTRLRIQARYSRVYTRLDFVNNIVIRQRSTVSE